MPHQVTRNLKFAKSSLILITVSNSFWALVFYHHNRFDQGLCIILCWCLHWLGCSKVPTDENEYLHSVVNHQLVIHHRVFFFISLLMLHQVPDYLLLMILEYDKASYTLANCRAGKKNALKDEARKRNGSSRSTWDTWTWNQNSRLRHPMLVATLLTNLPPRH